VRACDRRKVDMLSSVSFELSVKAVVGVIAVLVFTMGERLLTGDVEGGGQGNEAMSVEGLASSSSSSVRIRIGSCSWSEKATFFLILSGRGASVWMGAERALLWTPPAAPGFGFETVCGNKLYDFCGSLIGDTSVVGELSAEETAEEVE
jgi:hypothetical protein